MGRHLSKPPAFFLDRRRQSQYLFDTICEPSLASPPNDILIYSPSELIQRERRSGKMVQSVKCFSPKHEGLNGIPQNSRKKLCRVLAMPSGDPRRLLACQSNQSTSSKFIKSPASKSEVESDWGSYQCWLCTLPLVCKQARKHTCPHSCMHTQSRNPTLESSVKNIYTYYVMI